VQETPLAAGRGWRASRDAPRCTGGAFDGRAARAQPQGRADLPGALPGRPARRTRGHRPGQEARTRRAVRSDSHCGLHRNIFRRATAPRSCSAMCSAFARPRRRRGSRAARPLSRGAAAGARNARRTPTAGRVRAPSPCSPTMPAHDAAGAVRVPGPGGDRRLPAPPGGAPRRALPPVPARANTQPAFGCDLPDAQAAIARPSGLIVPTLEGDAIAAVTWFTDSGYSDLGLPRSPRTPERSPSGRRCRRPGSGRSAASASTRDARRTEASAPVP
jgi:hypothetical protein